MARPKPAKERPATVAVICNLTEQSFAEQRTYGIVPVLPVIPGIQYIARCAVNRAGLKDEELLDLPGMPKQLIKKCALGEEFALTEVADMRAARQETGEKVAFDRIEAYDIADDVVRGINQTLVTGMTGDGGAAFAGIFVCNGDMPTAAELKEFRDKLRACDEERVRNADSAWATYKNQMFCVDAIPAAKRLNVEDREWLSVYKPTKDCPVCYTKLDPRAVVCRSCQFVLDEKRALAMGFLKEEKPPASKQV